jgi:hypothetical protein
MRRYLVGTNEMTRRDLLRFGGFGLLSTGLESVFKPGFVLAARPAAKPGPGVETPLYLPTTAGGAAGGRFANTPNWAREAPGLFVPNTLSAGSALLLFPQPTMLQNQIKSFEDLPVLVEQAKSLGANIVYLMDWFDGGWDHRGDYIPSAEFGGPSAFTRGLAAAHAAGGRVILYIEFLAAKKSTNVGKASGAEWSIITQDGRPMEKPYPDNWKLCPKAEGWVGHLENVARRLAGYGADGLYIDSCGDNVRFECYSKSHGHPVGDNVFAEGEPALVKRVRATLESGRPEGAIILTEGPYREPLFEFADGSLAWGMHAFMSRWVWDAQGHTDTFLPCFSLDDWHQAVAVGAKLACPRQFLEPPPSPSAAGFLDRVLTKGIPEQPRIFETVIWGLHRWRNAGLILGLRMPGFGDLAARVPGSDSPIPVINSPEAVRHLLEGLRPRAAAIDAALAGRAAPSPASYIKTLLTARRSMGRLIDHGSSMEQVNSGSAQAAAWRFTGANGTALTAANVADEPGHVVFPNAAGTWRDAVSCEEFTARGGKLSVSVPAHRVRLLAVAAGFGA